MEKNSKASEYCCTEMQEIINDSSYDMEYDPREDETFLHSREGGGICWKFSFCPFCGRDIKGKSEIFRKTIKDELGIDTEDEDFLWSSLDERLPEEFKTDEWWKKRGL